MGDFIILKFLWQGFIFLCLLFQAEVIDVSYGNADDLKRIKKMKNVTNRIALLKLGKLPLLYKVGPMAVIWWCDYFVHLELHVLMCIWEYEEREKVGVCVREGAGREGRDRERQRSIGR